LDTTLNLVLMAATANIIPHSRTTNPNSALTDRVLAAARLGPSRPPVRLRPDMNPIGITHAVAMIYAKTRLAVFDVG
jgi:hypothetical protein